MRMFFSLTIWQSSNNMRSMQNMIPITIDLGKLPEKERRILCAEAVKRGVPFEQVVREALLAKASHEAKPPKVVRV